MFFTFGSKQWVPLKGRFETKSRANNQICIMKNQAGHCIEEDVKLGKITIRENS